MFQLENEKPFSAPPSLFSDNERSKQLMLLSGLKTCLPGQLDLFDVDAFPKETPDAQTHSDRTAD